LERQCKSCYGLGEVPEPNGLNCHSCAGLGAEVCCCECQGTGIEHIKCTECDGLGWVS
jgi:hypothetical protein